MINIGRRVEIRPAFGATEEETEADLSVWSEATVIEHAVDGDHLVRVTGTWDEIWLHPRRLRELP